MASYSPQGAMPPSRRDHSSDSEEEDDPALGDPLVVGQFTSLKGLGRVALGGAFIGAVAGSHSLLLLYAAHTSSLLLAQWSVYVLALACFHLSEFVVTAKYRPRDVSFRSFLLDDGRAYRIAVCCGWLEHGLEVWLCPWLKGLWYVSCVGLVLTAGGQYFRAAAMWTAKASFNHVIAEAKEDDHKLVTHGVYQWLRHPSYFGWYWWAVGTQVLLCNPVCTVLYAVVATQFFKRRIPYEELYLRRFFPGDYDVYMASTPIGIPGVRGADSLLAPIPPTIDRPAFRRQNTAGGRLQH